MSRPQMCCGYPLYTLLQHRVLRILALHLGVSTLNIALARGQRASPLSSDVDTGAGPSGYTCTCPLQVPRASPPPASRDDTAAEGFIRLPTIGQQRQSNLTRKRTKPATLASRSSQVCGILINNWYFFHRCLSEPLACPFDSLPPPTPTSDSDGRKVKWHLEQKLGTRYWWYVRLIVGNIKGKKVWNLC